MPAASSASRPGAAGSAAGRADPDIDAAPTSRSIWPAIYPELLKLVREHTSTIIFVNNRRGAERLAKRLNELNAEEPPWSSRPPSRRACGGRRQGQGGPAGASDEVAVERRCLPPAGARTRRKRSAASPAERTELSAELFPEIARAHHGSLAHEERQTVEELLKSGQLPCLVATSSLELGIDMGAVDLVIQVESPKSVTRGLQRIGRAGHTLDEVSKGRIFPKFRADLLECAVVARRMREGEIEETVIPRNPLDVLAQHLVSMCADDEWEVDEVERLVDRRRAVLGALPRAARERPRHARRPLPVRALRRAAAADRLGPRRRHHPRPPGGAPARGHQRRHDPRPRPLRRPPARRPPGRRARRGDGLRGASRADLPARRHHLADRGDHPRPGDRHPGAGRARRGAVLEGRRDRPPGGAGPGDRRLRPRGGERRAEAAGGRATTSTAARPRTWSPTCASSRRRPASCPPTRRSSSSASATRSATGGCACSRRGAAACTPPGAWRCRRGSATSTSSRPTRSGPTTGSSSTSPTPTSRRRPTSCCSSPTRSRTWWCASWEARPCSAPASARTPPGRC